MHKNKLRLLLAAVSLALPLSAGTVISTIADGPSGHTGGYVMEAQTFTAPSDTLLTSFQFQMFNAPGQHVQLEIFAWGASGPTGPALFTSLSLDRLNQVQDFVISGINLTLTQGSLYGAVVDNEGNISGDAAYNMNQTSYTGGNLWLLSQDTPTVWSNLPGYNLFFAANFQAGQAPASSGVPEPAAFLLMGSGLAIVGLLKFRGR